MVHRLSLLILLNSLLFASATPSVAQTPYLVQNTSNFQIAYTAPIRDHVGMALEMLDRSYQQISQGLAFYPSEPIRVMLHTNTDYPAPSNSPGSQAYYSYRDRTIHILYAWASTRSAADERMEVTLRHEMTHAFVHSMTPAAIPSWFNEGLAKYFELPPLDREVRLAAAIRDMRADRFRTLAQSPYYTGLAAIGHIADRYGMHTVRTILLETRHQPFEAAFVRVLGMDIPTFEGQLRDSLR